MANESFGTGLLQGLAQGIQQNRQFELLQQKRGQTDELHKLQINELKNKQKREQLKAEGMEDAKEFLAPGLKEVPEGTQGPPEVRPARTMMDMLTDPKGQMIALQSGLADVNTISKSNEAQKTREAFDNFISSQGMGGNSQFTPQSVQAAALGRNARLLKPARLKTAEFDTPDGSMLKSFDIDRPGELKTIGKPKKSEATVKRVDFAKKSKRSLVNVNKAITDAKGQQLQFITGPTGILTMLPEKLMTGPQQRIAIAGREWIMSVLRPESGAVIGKEELAGYMATYFPSVGDAKGSQELKFTMRDAITKASSESAGLTLDEFEAFGGGGGGNIINFEDLPE